MGAGLKGPAVAFESAPSSGGFGERRPGPAGRHSQIYAGRSTYSSHVNVEFECVICGSTATATVSETEADIDDRPLETLRDCRICELETIWVAT